MMHIYDAVKLVCFTIGLIAVVIGTGCVILGIWAAQHSDVLWRAGLSAGAVFLGALAMLLLSGFLVPTKTRIEKDKQ